MFGILSISTFCLFCMLTFPGCWHFGQFVFWIFWTIVVGYFWTRAGGNIAASFMRWFGYIDGASAHRRLNRMGLRQKHLTNRRGKSRCGATIVIPIWQTKVGNAISVRGAVNRCHVLNVVAAPTEKYPLRTPSPLRLLAQRWNLVVVALAWSSHWWCTPII